MAVRFKKAGKLGPHFIAEWRRYAGYTQDSLAAEIGASKATISRIEASRIPYSQDFLETVAEKFGCTPEDLLSRAPESATFDPRVRALAKRISGLDDATLNAVLLIIERVTEAAEDEAPDPGKPPAPPPLSKKKRDRRAGRGE